MRHLLRKVAQLAAPGVETLAEQVQNSWLGAHAEQLSTWVAVKGGSVVSFWAHNEPHNNAGKHGGPTLYQEEDLNSWIIFFGIFLVLILFDNFVMHRHQERIPFFRAVLFTLFWLGCAGLFGCYVWYARGAQDAFDWTTGYLLEWMLSVDNLFVFRSIFLVFRTPDDQKHKPLFWGIVGAIIFRMAFFVVEELLLHHFTWMHILLGAFLVYTGVKVILVDEEEDDPTQNTVYAKIIKCLPYVDAYSHKARFFERVPVSPEGELITQGIFTPPNSDSEDDGMMTPETPGTPGRHPKRLVATRLTLVTICLEITDVIFAVDSVSAIVAQIPDLFLAYTACVFAMLGLRATFFVVDELVNLFTFLPYAVAGILVFIGIKLMLRSYFHIPPEVVCCILISTLALSILASIVYDWSQGKTGFEALCSSLEEEADDMSCVSGRKTPTPSRENTMTAEDKMLSSAGMAAQASHDERFSGGAPVES